MSLLPPQVQATARNAREAGTRAAVEIATAGGERVARAADRAGPLLDRLDDRLLPAAGDALEATVARASAASQATATLFLRAAVRTRLLRPMPAPEHGARPGPPGTGGPRSGEDRPTGAHAGRSLVERAARAVVLGLVAMIIFSTAAALLGFGSPAPETGTRRNAGPLAPTLPTPTPNEIPRLTVGPYPGDTTASYTAIADQELSQYAQAAPGADLLAAVSLAGYQTPAQLHTLLADYRVTEVFFAVPSVGTVHSARVRDPVADVQAAFAAAAARAGDAEANALRGSCACLFAAVVRAPGSRLLLLRQQAGVRVVDPAPPGTLDNAVTFVPVTPERP